MNNPQRTWKWFNSFLAKSQGSKIFLWGTLSCIVLFLTLAVKKIDAGLLLETLDKFVLQWGNNYQQWFTQQSTANPLVLLSLSFAGGLIASISPCILSLLPVNLSYIGTREITSRKDALFKAGSFVLGVVTMLSIFGLFSSLAGIVLIQYRGYIQVAIGLLILGMGLSLLGIIRLPLPQGNLQFPIAGPYGVGLTFALVSSPCTSPVMFSVLAAGAATGSPLKSTLAMVCYALGYTGVIFFASLFTGLVKRTRIFLNHSERIIRLGSLALMLVGLYYLIDGILWIESTIKAFTR